MSFDTRTLTPEQVRALAPLAAVVGTLLITGLTIDVAVLLRIRRRPLQWTACLQRLRARPWTWREALPLGVLVILLNQLVFIVVQGLRAFGASDSAALAPALLLQTGWIPLCIVAYLLHRMRIHGLTWTQAFGRAGRSPWKELLIAPLVLLGVWPLLACAAWASSELFSRFGVPLEDQFVVKVLTDPEHPPWLRVYLCLAAVTVAPVIEEVGFRGILLPALARASRAWLAVVAASVLFAALHLNLSSFVPLFVLATALSLTYMRTGSLLVPIFMHALFNAISLGVLLYWSRVVGV